MRHWFRRRASEERGAVLLVVSIAMVVMIGATALAVDVGQVTVNNRDLQAAADVIALDAVRALGGGMTAVADAAEESAARNGFPPDQLTVKLGTKTGSAPFVETAVSPNAVRVTTHNTVDFTFAPGSGTSSRSAVAVQSKSAGFSIGSWLASIPAGGQGILGGLLGDAFHLNAVSYSGLVDANLTLEAIGAKIPAGVLTPTELLDTSVSVGDFMAASIAALSEQGQTVAVNALQDMIQATTTVGSIRLGDTVQVEPGGEASAATAALNVLQLLQASALVLEKNSGHALSIPTVGLTLPGGITSVTASVTVIEPPKIYFGPVGGPSVESAQVRLSITPVINLPIGIPGLLSVGVHGSLPIDLNVAGATASLADINCGAPSITVASTTQAVNSNTNLTLAVRAKVNLLLTSLILDVATVTLAGGAKTTPTTQQTTFAYPAEFGPDNVKPVGSNSLGLDGLLDFEDANISILNGIISLGQVVGSVLPAVNGLLGGLDDALVAPLTSALGLKLGGADIAALGMSCSGLRLAE